MMDDYPDPSPALLAGRRSLEGLEGVTLLDDWIWDNSTERWVLHCRLSPGIADGKSVPPETDWFMHIDPSYPWGTIKFYPSKANGITQTFQHQRYNGPGKDEVLWRTGDLCVATGVRVIGRQEYDAEPFDIHKRLRWNFTRALEWLRDASKDALIRNGEPFELPQYPRQKDYTVAFSEDVSTLADWQATKADVGFVKVYSLTDDSTVFFTTSFYSARGELLVTAKWGSALTDRKKDSSQALWFRFKSPLVLPPWQAPITWQDLKQASAAQGIDIIKSLESVVRRIRDGRRHFALLGFPIPNKRGEADCQMHWQPLLLPVFSYGQTTAVGFRNNEIGYWYRDRTEVIFNELPLDWCIADNWNKKQISTRGRFDDHVASRQVLLVGAGTLGSCTAEMLVRGGLGSAVLIDGDTLSGGNLVRHTLDLDDVGKDKAPSLAEHLNLVSPHADIIPITAAFPPKNAKDVEQVQACSTIVETTGDDEVLHHLETFPWDADKLFVSLSIGFRAHRLFMFAARGRSFPQALFHKMVSPLLIQETQEYAGQEFPREGVGCWHPVFPARADDVWLLAAAGIKQLESYLVKPPDLPTLTVFEQTYDDGVFSGIRKITIPSDHA